jgi:amino acid transporter
MTTVIDLASLALALAFALAGSSVLMLSQSRNWRKVTGRIDSAPSRARLGWLLVGLAFVPSAWRDGIGFALLVWPLIFAVAAFGVAIIVAFRPRAFHRLALLLAPETIQPRR